MYSEEERLLKEKYNGQRTSDFERDTVRLNQGEPLAYIIGNIPFLSTTIFLDSLPLIPRPETEFLVAQIIETYGHHPPQRVLDLCAGSGCIGVALLSAWQMCHVDFGEIDVTHHPTIEKNILHNAVAGRSMVYASDLYATIPHRYDLIIANPPYIPDARIQTLDTSVKNFEPHLALKGGQHGDEIINRILADTPSHLAHNGNLYLEHDHTHTFPGTYGGFSMTEAMTDQYGVKRYTRFLRSPF